MPANNVRNMSTDGLDPEYLARRAALPKCVVCERPMRPAGEKLSDWPATVAYATVDQCKSCYARKYNKGMSVAEALKPTKVRKVRTGRTGLKSIPVLDLPRAEVAQRWTEEERSAALQVCEMTLHAEGYPDGDAPAAAEILEMLGLFEAEKPLGYGDATPFQDSKIN